MPQAPLTQVLGTTRKWRVQVRTTANAPVTEFLETDPITATLWTGDDQSPLFFPAVAWSDPEGGWFRLQITSEMIEDLEPGTYHLQVFSTPVSDNERRCLYDGTIRFTPTAGAQEALPVFSSWNDLLKYCPQIAKLQDEFADQTNFAEQRSRARTWFIGEVLRRYNPHPGRSRRMVNEDGTATGAHDRFMPIPAGKSIPSDSELRTILETEGCLVLTDDIRESVSHKAASFILLATPSGAFTQQGGREASMAWASFDRAAVDVKTDPLLDAPDIRVDRDITFLV